jgi:hypothetical protein
MLTDEQNKKWFGILVFILCCLLLACPAWAGTAWLQKQKLTASDGAAWDDFGWSVSISGDYAIIGAVCDDDKGINSGSAYIFRRDRTGWSQQRKLTASDGAAGDCFGFSVSITCACATTGAGSGDMAIVGAERDDDKGYWSGSAYVFRRDGTAWVEQQKLTASDGAAKDRFGHSVSISGDYVIVGANGDGDKGTSSGSAYIFRWDRTGWSQQAKLLAADGAAGDQFGESVSISGDKAIVGASYGYGNIPNSGSAYIFKRDGTGWVQQQKLTASDGAAEDYFGCSVSISGDKTIVGARGDDDKGNDSGSAYIFRWDGTAWVQQQKLIASDGAAGDQFGESVSISGDYAIVGAAYDDDKGDRSGSAYIFKRDGMSWGQQAKMLAPDGDVWDSFGNSVSISGDFAIVGAYGNNDKGDDSGSAYIFIPTGDRHTDSSGT